MGSRCATVDMRSVLLRLAIAFWIGLCRVPGVATTRRDGSGAWRPSSRREAAPPPEVRSMTETSSEPSFVGAMLNMTVPVGRDVDLDCQVKNAEGFKVGWIKASDQTVLSLHKKVITHNPRIKVTHDEHRTWTLRILSVREEDQGCYMCQINTAKMMLQVGCIKVLVPPDINSEMTSSDVTVNEGSNATMTCKAFGLPRPEITWRREDGREFVVWERRGIKRKVYEHHGEYLHLSRVRRQDMGAFMCIAKNGVPPPVSKRMVLNVNFQPTIHISKSLIGCPVGEAVTLSCTVEAYPDPISYWIRRPALRPGILGIVDGRRSTLDPAEMIMSSANFDVVTLRSGGEYKETISLTIKKFKPSDEGTYTCTSTNSLGKKESTVRLYAIERQSGKSPMTETTITTDSDLRYVGADADIHKRRQENRKKRKKDKAAEKKSDPFQTDRVFSGGVGFSHYSESATYLLLPLLIITWFRRTCY